MNLEGVGGNPPDNSMFDINCVVRTKYNIFYSGVEFIRNSRCVVHPFPARRRLNRTL